MCEFILETFKPTNKDKHAFRIFYTKNQYVPEVKNHDWTRYAEGLPYDSDPFEPGNLDSHRSHYKRFTTEPDVPWQTTTQAMLEQVYIKQSFKGPNPNKPLMSYYTYNDHMECEGDKYNLRAVCPYLCAHDYLSTMQESYVPPCPTKIERLKIPKTPFLLNRKLKSPKADYSDQMFYDDNFHDEGDALRAIKSDRWVSYDFTKGTMTDGTEPDTLDE